MEFNTLCFTKIFNQSNRQEALDDYASLIKSLYYDEVFGEMYARQFRDQDKGGIMVTAKDLEDAKVTEGHDCSYICGKYDTKEYCDKCPMKDSDKAPLIVAGDDDVTNNNIRELEEDMKVSAVNNIRKETENTAADSANTEEPKDNQPETAVTKEECFISKEDPEQAEKERRLIIHILSQSPSRVKTMLPTQKEEMEKIKLHLTSKINLSVDSGTPSYIPVNAIIYESLYTCVSKKYISSNTVFAKNIQGKDYLNLLAVSSMNSDSIQTKIVEYYENLRIKALSYAEEYAKLSVDKKKKTREDILSFFKEEKTISRKKVSEREIAFSGNFSIMDMIDKAEKTQGCTENTPQTKTQEKEKEIVLDILEDPRTILNQGESENIQPENSSSAADADIDETEVNPHAIILPNVSYEPTTPFEKNEYMDDPALLKLIEPSEEELPAPLPEKKPKKKKKSEKQEKQEKQEETPPVSAEETPPSFKYTVRSFSDSLFPDEDDELFRIQEEKARKNLVKNTIIRDNNKGNYSYEVTVDQGWLDRNGFILLEKLDEVRAKSEIMHSFMGSYTTGVEVVRKNEDKTLYLLLFFEDVRKRYYLMTSSPMIVETVKHFLKNERLYKKVSSCPMAVFAMCAARGFMAKNVSYTEGFMRPCGAFAPESVIREKGFEAYNPENWKKVAISRTDGYQMCLERALSRSLYINGFKRPFIEVKGNKRVLNTYKPSGDCIILKPQIVNLTKEEDFIKFADEIIRKLEEENIFVKHKTWIISLDYSKREIAYVMGKEYYRAFREYLGHLNAKKLRWFFSYFKIPPTVYYAAENISKEEPKEQTSEETEKTPDSES